ncbi:MAG: hypothetical protein AAF587_39050 [Bacteroidota bacterium]
MTGRFDILDDHRMLTQLVQEREFVALVEYVMQKAEQAGDLKNYIQSVILGEDFLRWLYLARTSRGEQQLEYYREMKRALRGLFELIGDIHQYAIIKNQLSQK